MIITRATYRAPEALYIAEEHPHGVVLTVTPCGEDGEVRGSECTNVATVYRMWDAFQVAMLHARAYGYTTPLEVTATAVEP